MVSELSETNMRLVRETLGQEAADQIEESLRRQNAAAGSAGYDVEHLRLAYLRLQAVEQFKTGELVVWKAGLVPASAKGPFVFDRYIETFCSEESIPVERCYDCVIGFLDRDGDLALIYADSRRLRHWRRPDSPKAKGGPHE